MSEAILGRNLFALDSLEGAVEQVIRQLPLRGPDGKYLVDDEALRTTTLTASSGAKTLWKLACAARAEIVRRLTERTPDQTVLRHEVAREAAQQGVSVRTFKRDAEIGAVFGQLFVEPDAAPDLGATFYEVARTAPDPKAALTLAMERKDADPLYTANDFAAEIARARMADPAAGYGLTSKERCGLALLWPYWDQGVLEATEEALALPLHRWLLPDSVVLVRIPPRALDLGMRLLAAHEVRYGTTILLPVPPYNDSFAWHEHEFLLCGTRGKVRLPMGMPGTWRDPKVDRCIDMHFAFIALKLAVHPRCGMTMGEGWMTPDTLPESVR